MVKICKNCLNTFEGHISIDNCPNRECGGRKLIEFDDMLADVDLSTGFHCLGPLYESGFSPYIMFFEPGDNEGREALTFLRDMFVNLNLDENQIEISEIKPLWQFDVFTVRAKKCQDDAIK